MSKRDWIIQFLICLPLLIVICVADGLTSAPHSNIPMSIIMCYTFYIGGNALLFAGGGKGFYTFKTEKEAKRMRIVMWIMFAVIILLTVILGVKTYLLG